MKKDNDPTPNTPWHILGLGAMGGLFACHLQEAGLSVAVCPPPRQDTADNVALTLETDHGSQGFSFPLSPSTPIQRLVLATKAHQSEAALASVRHRLVDGATLVVLQNGLGIQEWLSREYPTLKIVAATTTQGAHRPAPDHVRHAGQGMTWIGPWRPCDHHAAREVCHAWSGMAMVLTFDPDIPKRLWEKLVVNCAINPLTTLLDCRNGELLRHSGTREWMRLVVNEVASVMRAQGMSADEAALFEHTLAVAGRTEANISSMLQDRRAGRQTEMAFINGYVARKALELGISTPLNAWLTEEVEHQKDTLSTETVQAKLRDMPTQKQVIE